MGQAPIVVKCECGVETRGRAGDVIRCTGCGLAYDTGKELASFNLLATRIQRQFKYLSRAGIGVVGLSGLLGAVLFQLWGLVAFAAVGGVAWYGLFLPFQKKRMMRKATTLYTPTVAPTRK
ncbi:MAG: hypothetical protein ACR2J9_11990 [Gaiellales bacterium]